MGIEKSIYYRLPVASINWNGKTFCYCSFMFLVAVEFKSIFVCARYIRKYTLIMRFQKNKRRMMKIPEGTFTTWQRHVDSHSRACSKAHLTVFATTRITSTRTESCYFIFTDHCTKTWQKNCKTKGYACSGTRSTSLAMELATGKPRCARSILPFAIKNRLHVQKKFSFLFPLFWKISKNPKWYQHSKCFRQTDSELPLQIKLCLLEHFYYLQNDLGFEQFCF